MDVDGFVSEVLNYIYELGIKYRDFSFM